MTGRRERILQLLRSAGEPQSIVQLADELHVHPNTVRFNLDALMRSGQVEQLIGEPVGRGRPPVLFRATHRMDPSGPTNYRLLATMLTGHLATSSPDPEGTAAQVGREWGPHLLDAEPSSGGTHRVTRASAVNRMVDVLADLGFEPETPTGPRDSTVRLRHCPFLDLTSGLGEPGRVVCALHLGLMQGTLAAMNGPVTVDRLEPFREPDLCVAHLAAGGPS